MIKYIEYDEIMSGGFYIYVEDYSEKGRNRKRREKARENKECPCHTCGHGIYCLDCYNISVLPKTTIAQIYCREDMKKWRKEFDKEKIIRNGNKGKIVFALDELFKNVDSRVQFIVQKEVIFEAFDRKRTLRNMYWAYSYWLDPCKDRYRYQIDIS